jgi:hypothetical protein
MNVSTYFNRCIEFEKAWFFQEYFSSREDQSLRGECSNKEATIRTDNSAEERNHMQTFDIRFRKIDELCIAGMVDCE